MINKYCLNSAPIKIYGEGHYAIGVAKALTATQSFLRLAESVTRCQSRASREDCLHSRYVREVGQACDCTPLNIREFPQQDRDNATLCSPEQLDCVSRIRLFLSDCLPACEGVFITHLDEV